MTAFIIAEAGSSHDNDLQKAYRLIEAAKECGASAFKLQYWSDSKKLANRRLMPENEAKYEAYRISKQFVDDCYTRAQKVGIQFLCTTYLIEDIPFIAQYVKMFKVSAFEAEWREFISAHCQYEKPLIISVNRNMKRLSFCHDTNFLYCVSKYPTALEDLHLSRREHFDGLSDHTANVLTGAAAVAAGARIIEAHIRLHDTDPGNPDYGHSLVADKWEEDKAGAWGEPETWTHWPAFGTYVESIRIVEKMM